LLPATVEKAHKSRRLLAGALEQIGAGNIGERLVVLEIAVRAETAGVHDALRDTLMVEVKDLFAEVEIFERGRSARSDTQRILVVGDRHPLLSS
jgi:hypothetical protein